jgi:hypothetical protein
VYAALGALAPLHPDCRKDLEDALSAEIRGHYALLVWQSDIGVAADGSLLGEALVVRLGRSLDRICLLLDLLYPHAPIAGLRHALEEGQAKDRAMAIELLDTLLAGEAKALLIPALEGSAEHRLAVAEKRLGIVREPRDRRLALLAQADDAWLRECARQQIGGTMALSNIERILFLKSADLFSQLGGEDLGPLAETAQEVHFPAGETFIHQDDPGSCLYLIVDGKASIVVHGLGQIGTRGPKGAIGEMAIIWRRPRSADCVALTDITALRIEYDDFWDLMDQRPTLAQGVITLLARRLDEAMDTLQRLGHV